MKHLFGKIAKWIIGTVLCIMALVILVIIAIYIPPVQNAIFRKVVTELNKGETLNISYDKLSLGFPAHLKGENLKVKLPGEMDASLQWIDANLRFWPLLALDISTDDIKIKEARFRLGVPDSGLYLTASIDTFDVDDISVKIKDADISFSKGYVGGADVSLILKDSEEEKPEKEKKVAGKQFVINAGDLLMHDLDYFMVIEGTIDTLSADVMDIELKKGLVDLNTHKISAENFDVNDVVVKYIFPGLQGAGKVEKSRLGKEAAMPDSVPWTITVDQMTFTAANALYAKRNFPNPGYFSPDYIDARNIAINVDSFYNCRQDIHIPIKKLHVGDICGMSLNASGTFAIDNSIMSVQDFDLMLPGSTVKVDALMGLEGERFRNKEEIPVKIDLNADIAPGDIMVFLPEFDDVLKSLPKATPILANIRASGTMDNIDVKELSVELPRYLTIGANGYAAGFSGNEMKHFSSNLKFNGRLLNTAVIKPSVVASKLGAGIHLVPFGINGNLAFNNGNGKADVKVTALEGNLALAGNINFRREGYDVKFDTHNFPVQSIMPGLGIADVSARINASGSRFNPLSKNASLTAQVNVDTLYYHHLKLSAIQLNANIDGGEAQLALNSNMTEADLSLRAHGNIDTKDYQWFLNGDIRNIELQDLGFSKIPNGGSLRIDGNFEMNTDSAYVHADIELPEVKWHVDDRSVSTKELALSLDADREGTVFDLTDRDLLFEISSPEALDTIIANIPKLTHILDSCIKKFDFNIPEIQQALPEFTVTFTAEKNNLLSQWMSYRGESFDSVGVSIKNYETLSLNGIIKNYDTPKYIVDSITAKITQKNDSLDYRFHLINSPMSPGDWANVLLFGRVGGNELNLRFNQKNHEGKTGFLLGFNSEFKDSTLTLRFVPVSPVIAYKQWEINDNNFVSLDFADKHFDSNLMISHGNSSLRLYTDHLEGSDEQEEINLKLTDIEIGDWLSLNPFATPMKGLLSGQVSLSHEGKIYMGDGNVRLANFYYGKQRVGTFDLGVDITTTPHGFIHAGVSMDIDSAKVINLYGVLNDTTAVNPFMLKLDIDSLPLKVANPFLANAGIQLSGELNGTMNVTGDPSTPVFNGYVAFDSTGVKVDILGTTYMMSNKKIPVDTGIVRFDNYDIKGVNNNPLIINGTVNMHSVFNPVIDLGFKANNIQLVGTDRARGAADIYGKAFVNLDATVKGDMSYIDVKASADLLNTSNVTYVMVGGPQSALSSRSNSNLVKFVNFADTSMVADADSIKLHGMLLNLNAYLEIQRGAVIGVDLSSDGKNKVQLEPVGDLDFSIDVLGAQHLTGRITLDGGFARYTPPLMSEKLFNIQEGSYIDFNGNITNPLLNIHAVDRLRANVTQEGQNSRLIYFNVGVDITGSLENMNVAFNLSTDDDLTVENELESMSPSQRASKAMNLLITNTYSGPGTTADANLGANALYSFLGSTLNSWAANNIKAVDLSFGVNQYENTTNGVTSQATSYSYNVSKSLLDDRFKINIGGNYTTDAGADENFAENLISDVSIEYMLNPNGSMYIKIFRHAGYESILEGEIIQTGVGFTYRKRLNSLRQMLWFILPKRYRYNSVIDRELEKYKVKLSKKEEKAKKQ